MAVQYFPTNKNICEMSEDVLYHLDLSTKTTNFEELFGNVRFVCTSGSKSRIEAYAQEFAKVAGLNPNTIKCLSGQHARFSIYKVGSVLLVDLDCSFRFFLKQANEGAEESLQHGMGMPSMSIMLHEITKLIWHAKCKDVEIIRLGTSGGLGVVPGTLVVTTESVNCQFKPLHDVYVLGKLVQYESKFDQKIVEELMTIGKSLNLKYPIVKGKTLSANDFYVEQARMDGSVCEFTIEEKRAYLKSAQDSGITNFEMEGLLLGAHCNKVGLRCAMVCVIIVNRSESDQVKLAPDEFQEIERMPGKLITEYLKKMKAFV